jgi:hypothetical protein
VTFRADRRSFNCRLKRSRIHTFSTSALDRIGHLHAPASLPRRNECSQPTEYEEGPTAASLDASEHRKFTCPFRKSNRVQACYVSCSHISLFLRQFPFANRWAPADGHSYPSSSCLQKPSCPPTYLQFFLIYT